MSEESASYHLRAGNEDEAVALLEAAGRRGFVLQGANGWVSFVTGDDLEREVDQEVARRAPALLLHYVDDEERGWGFSVWSRGRLMSEYTCSWEDGLEIEAGGLRFDDLVELLEASGVDLDPVEFELELAVTDPEILVDEDQRGPAHRVAALLGLPHYEWLSARYLTVDRAATGLDDRVIEVPGPR